MVAPGLDSVVRGEAQIKFTAPQRTGCGIMKAVKPSAMAEVMILPREWRGR